MKKNIIIKSCLLLLLFLQTGCDLLSPMYRMYKDAIYIIDADGHNLRKIFDLYHRTGCEGPTIANLPGADVQFTADGEKLIFYSRTDWYSLYTNLYSINVDGSDLTLIAYNIKNRNSLGQLSISTLEQKIAFPADIMNDKKNPEEHSDVFIVNFDGSGMMNLTNTFEIDEVYPCLSPDGEDIIFSSINHIHPDNRYSIIKLNIEIGSLDTLAQNNVFMYENLHFSPDGSKIYFSDHRRLFVLNSDGTDQAVLYDIPGTYLYDYLSFSSDGSKIVSNYYDHFIIMNTDGSGYNQIELNEGVDRYPNISYYGDRIVYSNHSIIGKICTINSDGSNEQIVTYEGFKPVFSPDSDKIAFSGYYFYKKVHCE